MDRLLTKLQDLYAQCTAPLHAYRGALRCLRPHRLDGVAGQRLDGDTKGSVIYDNLPREAKDAMRMTVRAGVEREYRLVTAVARHRAHAIRDRIAEARALMADARRDVLRSMPQARLGQTPGGTLLEIIARKIARDEVRVSPPATLTERHRQAIAGGRLADLIVAEEIELLAGTTQLAETDEQIADARALRLAIAESQELRVPLDAPDFDSLDAQLNALDARADAIGLQPIDDAAAAAAFESMRELLAQAGATSDEDDHRAMREAERQLVSANMGIE